ncbi:amidase [Labrys wisconsinensis]|uniref:Indoleacetamide hydrolase n=1 Tax=Labrys wisconsinensis TaxID=425677 RepID=A0ABU0J5E7_9HYPH|nr:amidase family protein [Labrys wisconsinensis]MDQ0469491.1 amidase [Labrys wisconsinensis]
MARVTSDLVRLYADSDALALAELVRGKQVSPLELVETAISLVEALDPRLNAVVIRTFDLARQAALAPPTGPFGGVPFLLKNIASMWQGTPLTNGLGYFSDFVCDHDSEMVRRIKAAGFLLVGRSNTPECGWSIGTEPRLYGPTMNPWNPAITCGGSSGGAAAAVAARIVPLAEASDGGGSIRVPASCCGLVGLKPSRGRITYGPEAVDLWFGSIAIFCVTRTVRDSAAYLDAVAGPMTGDPYLAPTPAKGWLAGLAEPPARLRIGYTLAAPWGPPVASDVAAALHETLRLLERLGHHVEEHDLAVDLEQVWPHYNAINAVETAADFDRVTAANGRPIGEADFMPLNWSLLQHARSLSAVQYSESIAAVRKASQRLAIELAPYDVFLTPTLTQPPRPVGYWSMEDGDRLRYLARWSDAAYMFAFNLSGLPALSVPAAMADGATPIGLQLVGRHGDEATLLRLARQMEEDLRWDLRRPPVSAG